MIQSLISVYETAFSKQSKEELPLDIFLENIRNGKWQDYVLPIRAIKNKEEKEKAKKKVPAVTISGRFEERLDDKIIAHSGYIAVDLDNLEDPEKVKEIISSDSYVAAAFKSISGLGLCVLFKINPLKHREAYKGISEYLYNKYKLIVDPTGLNPSRLRFVSFDPYIYIAEKCTKFAEYPKEKEPKKIERVIYSQDDFSRILKQIVDQRINIDKDDYHTWLRIGFAICDKFGESGRQYFHTVSQFSVKYDPDTCDKQYSAIVKHKPSGGNKTTISTFYYYAKEAGVDIYSDRTRIIAHTASQGKKSGLNVEQVVENLEKFEDIKDEPGSSDKVADIVKQVFQSGIDIGGETLLDELEMFIRQNYSLRRNEITRFIENNGVALAQKDLNTIFVKAKKVLPKINYELIERLINSDFVPSYNPLKLFMESAIKGEADSLINFNFGAGPHLPINSIVQELKSHAPLITKLFSTIQTKDPDFLLYFGAKWLVSMVSAIYGEHSPLMLVLSGEKQNTGKTEWFRRLLPNDLRNYYAESKLDREKDDEILMTQKLLIMDDEMGGKSKKEIKRLKELTSKQVFTLREPYGRYNVDLVRLAVLAGTTNDNEILYDPTGNRRIIPIHVYSINHQLYNSIDKLQLLREVYALYKAGLRWRFTKEDIQYLGTDSASFEMSSGECELIQKYFEPGDAEQLTASEIKVYIEKHTNQRLILDRIAKELKRLGFEQKYIRWGASTRRVYGVNHLTGLGNAIQPPQMPPDDLPF